MRGGKVVDLGAAAAAARLGATPRRKRWDRKKRSIAWETCENPTHSKEEPPQHLPDGKAHVRITWPPLLQRIEAPKYYRRNNNPQREAHRHACKFHGKTIVDVCGQLCPARDAAC